MNKPDTRPQIQFFPELDKWNQRLKETPPDSLEAIRQEHEGFLAQLEALAVEAIARNDWSEFHDHIDFNAPQVEADTKDLHRPGAGSSKTTEVNERKD